MEEASENFVEIPINGVLDLHTFSPKEVKFLVNDYLEECVKRKITNIRIIHGKGIGNLRRTVEAILSKSPLVVRWFPAGTDNGNWGATTAELIKYTNNKNLQD